METKTVESIRKQFPILSKKDSRGRDIIYLDNGATTQKPLSVIEKENEVYSQYNANAYRGVYEFGQRVDDELELSRATVQRLIGAAAKEEIVFTSGTTMSLNIVAQCWGEYVLNPGDEILLSEMEHHANIVPWQMIAKKKEAQIKYIPLNENYKLDLEQFKKLLTPRTKIVSLTGMSNVLGTSVPIREIAEAVHSVGAVIVVDAAQSVVHAPVDVVGQDIDFLALSGHKIYGPSGIGILYGKKELLEQMPPLMGGGHMIDQVFADHSTWAAPPAKFEAGTIPIAQAIALRPALELIEEIGFEWIKEHENQLRDHGIEKLEQIPGLKIYGPKSLNRGAILSFTVEGAHAQDLAFLLNTKGICVRHGHHCAMPLHEKLGISASVRASFGIYNTLSEIDQLVEAINAARTKLRLC